MATGAVRALLRLEGGVLATALYFAQGGNPWLLVPLILAVDASMAG